MNKIKKNDQLRIRFIDKNLRVPEGIFTVEKLLSKSHFLVTYKNGSNIVLDVREHGKTYRVLSVHSI